MEDLEQQVLDLAPDKGILEEANEIKQLAKFDEECLEFIEAVHTEELDNIVSEGGDVLVTLIVQASLQGTSLSEMLEVAYNKISKRKGKLVDGVFVKEG